MATEVRVLHVDDEPDFADITATFLEREDDRFAVETATSADEGLARLDDDTDCIVSDYDMPGTNGIEFLETVRAEYPEMPFILFTGKGNEEIASEAISAGVTDYLQKSAGTSHYTVLANRIDNAVGQYRAERELQRQMDRFAALFENFPEPTLAYAYEDGEPHIRRINEAFTEVFDVERETARDEHVDDVIVAPPESKDPATVDERVRAGERVDDVLRRRTGDGVREFRFRNVPLADDDDVDGYAVYADITERKAHERELERKNDLFAKTQNLADVGAWEWYPLREEGYYSQQVYDIYGVDSRPHRTPETDLQEFYHPEDRDRLRRAFERAVETGEPYDVEVRVTAADGTEKWVRTRGDPEIQDGQVVRVRGTIQDITERKRRERELERNERILEAINDGVVVVEDRTITYANPAVSELFGYAPDELEGERVTEFIAPEHRDTVRRRFQQRIAGQDPPKTYDIAVRAKDGTEIPAEITVARITDADESVTVSIVRDVTERKHRERQLKRQNERLDAFAGMVSHDLRNPLQVARGKLELGRETGDDDALADAADALDRSQALIDDLLTLARQGESVGEGEPVDIAAVVEDCWQYVDTAEATLVVDTDRTVRADGDRIARLLENLLDNAVEHGGPGVTVTVGDFEAGFYVADDGPGIPDGEREQVFEGGYTTADGGTGFGLAIVREIAEAHGWTVRVTDSADGGARFDITGVGTAG